MHYLLLKNCLEIIGSGQSQFRFNQIGASAVKSVVSYNKVTVIFIT